MVLLRLYIDETVLSHQAGEFADDAVGVGSEKMTGVHVGVVGEGCDLGQCGTGVVGGGAGFGDADDATGARHAPIFL